jgi:putative peptidoglycan lipid II flippase
VKKFQFSSIVTLANAKMPVRMVAVILAASTLISALLGIFRDRLLNSQYLDTYPTGIDAYTAAFTIPDFMFFILVSGALSVTFIPVFNQRLVAGNKKSAWELSSSVMNILALVTLVASILIVIFAEPLVRYVVGPGLDESSRELAVAMMRIIAVNPFLFAISTVLTSIQQSVGRFVYYALAPVFYNIGIIVGIKYFANGIDIFGWHVFDGGIMGVAFGVALGAMLQLLVSAIGLFGLGFNYEFKIYWRNLGFKKVLGLLPARSLDQGIDYINGIVEMNLASRMVAGTLRSYQQALSIHLMPINLIGVAISTAFFPKMTEDLGRGDENSFLSSFRSSLRMVIWVALPVSVVAFFGRGYVVSFIKNGGDALISALLGALVVSIFCRSIFHVLVRAFYARQNTKTPLFVSVFAIGVNIALAIIFTFSFGMGAYGLAFAQSIGAILEVLILLFVLIVQHKNAFTSQFVGAILRMFLAGLATSVVAYSMVKLFPLDINDQSFFLTFPKFLLIVATSFAAYMIACYLLNLKETKPVTEALKKVLFRNVK